MRNVIFNVRLPRILLALLSGAGLAVDRFEVLTPTLEQIFVEKAGETA